MALHDFRIAQSSVQRVVSTDAWTGAAWSPVGGHLFAGCDEGGRLRLYDSRKSFTQVDSSRQMMSEYQAGIAKQSPPVVDVSFLSNYSAHSSSEMSKLMISTMCQYLTSLTRYRAGSSICPDLSGVEFSPDGTMLATNILVRFRLFDRFTSVLYTSERLCTPLDVSASSYSDIDRSCTPLAMHFPWQQCPERSDPMGRLSVQESRRT